MRAFFAIKVPETVLDQIMQETIALRGGVAGVKWTPKNQIHLTLKFMGEFDPIHADPLQSYLATTCRETKRFTLASSGIGIFPTRGNPRVIWYGIVASTDLTRLAGKIEDACAYFGYARDKRVFSPHLTIGRVKQNARIEDFQSIRQSVAAFKTNRKYIFTVTALHCIKSTLTPAGPIYSDLFHVPTT